MPVADRSAPKRSRRGRSSLGTSRMIREPSRMPAAMTTSAAKTHRQL